MSETDPYETELLATYDEGELESVASKFDLSTFKAAARTTTIKSRQDSAQTITLAAIVKASGDERWRAGARPDDIEQLRAGRRAAP